MAQTIAASQMLDAFKQDATGHVAVTRWAHTHGIGVLGSFIASEVAKQYCIAEHFNGTAVPVTARLSNGSSDPQRHDARPDTRGLAVKYHYADGTDHDLLAMTLSVFGAKTREQFLQVSKAFVPPPIPPRQSWFRRNILDPLRLRLPPPPFPKGVTMSGGPGLAVYAGSHAFARAFILQAGMAQVPVSWARTAYHAVHTFIIVGPDGVRRPVRFSWQPVAGVLPVPPDDLPGKATDFLTAELRARLKYAPVRFTLKMDLGDPGDDLDDPSASWPVTRRNVRMGTLYLDRMADVTPVNVERMSFNPMRLPPGIEPSGDEILRARGEIYELGCQERGGMGCPMRSSGLADTAREVSA
jgi:catalase